MLKILLESVAKISKEINKISTCRKKFFPYPDCISADYEFLIFCNVIFLSVNLPQISPAKTKIFNSFFCYIFTKNILSPFKKI